MAEPATSVFFCGPQRDLFYIFFILANMYVTKPPKRDKDRSSCILLYKIPAYNECVIFQYILLFFKDNENDVVGQTLQTYQRGKFVPYVLGPMHVQKAMGQKVIVKA